LRAHQQESYRTRPDVTAARPATWRMMAASPPAAAIKAYELMRNGRIEEAIVLAEQAVGGALVCSPGHGFLASLLLKQGRVADAERIVSAALQLATGVADAYDG